MLDRRALKGELIHLDEDIGISYQDIKGSAFCHCQVRRATASILRRCKGLIRSLHAEHRRDAFAVCGRGDEKHQKFLRLMGFQFVRRRWIEVDGEDRIVEIWVIPWDGESGRYD